MLWSLLALCAVGAVSATSTSKTTGNRDRRSTFLNIVGERPSKSGYNSPVLPAELPIQLGGHGGVNLPVLVLPVPVFTKASDTCGVNNEPAPVENEASHSATRLPIIPPYIASRQQFNQAPNIRYPTDSEPQQPIQYNRDPQYTPEQPQDPNYVSSERVNLQTESNRYITPNFNLRGENKAYKPHTTAVFEKEPNGHFNQHFEQQPGSNEVEFAESAPEEDYIPFSEGREEIFATSEELIESFCRQKPKAPELAAVVPSKRRLPERIPVRGTDAPPESTTSGSLPPIPDFGRSLHLRIDLTVPLSDYTEAYDIQWHAESNTARTVVEDGTTVIYRVPLLDGRVQFLKVQVDRTNGTAVRRCTMSPLLPASPADKAFPGLPDLSPFYFVGYTTAEGQTQVERWQYVLLGKPGENGAVQGESLNITHEMLITRDRGNAVPLRYSVITDSSVLGPSSDSYTHRYQLLPAPTGAIIPDTSKECDVVEQLKDRTRRQIGRLISGVTSAATMVFDDFNPLKPFTDRGRYSGYDDRFNDYTGKFKRKYRNRKEKAVRKSQFIKTLRYVEAANRVASSFKTTLNFLADRVAEELDGLFGAVPPPKGVSPPGGAAPEFTGLQAENEAKNFPEEFDWRTEGAVTEVRYQGTKCKSCWAFAVAGSVEGALFNKTGKLVSLSPQCQLDCGMSKGTMGCAGGWPTFAYGYVMEKGLPTWDSYMYKEKVEECRDTSVPTVTKITDYALVQSNSEAALKVAIYRHAPTVVIVGANTESFKTYHMGILDDTRCSSIQDHAILAIGWGSKGGSHFVIKNSWGTMWGRGGFGSIEASSCSILDEPTYALVDDPPNVFKDVLNQTPASKAARYMPAH